MANQALREGEVGEDMMWVIAALIRAVTLNLPCIGKRMPAGGGTLR